jgi:hypothetical protein
MRLACRALFVGTGDMRPTDSSADVIALITT